MLSTVRINAQSYYSYLPNSAHECGDIWRGLPTFGSLGCESCCGIVITPACDLSWHKSETVTYLPIVSIRSYFSLGSALPAVLEKLLGALRATGAEVTPIWSAETYIPPAEEDLLGADATLRMFLSEKQRSEKARGAVDRALAGLEILRVMRSNPGGEVNVDSLSKLFGSEWPKIKQRIISNSYSPSLHFIPCDEQNVTFSGVSAHSVILFRYPITLPVSVLTVAQESPAGSWPDRIRRVGFPEHLTTALSSAHPIKLLSLRPAFLSDLLTRFSSLYNRVGSPDFSPDTLRRFEIEVDA
ncbi:hypothetical protein NKH47_22290 [Mesorhizobium sp. M1060]|uniref:hypothetical protein n=1 Tax=unclassified Mesorhizobium TaxID=325217 RepID=UPI00333D8F1B